MVSITLPDGTTVQIENWTDQIYSMEDLDGTQYHWSVSMALEKAKACGDLRLISLKEIGVTVERVRQQYDDMDERYAMSTDLTRPLVFVPLRDEVQLIDGWHRLFKAAVLGVDELLAYFLTEADAADCLVCKFPRGKGLDWGQRSQR